MLPDKRFNQRKCLTATRSSDYPSSSKTVGYVNKAFSEFLLIVVSHRDIYAIFVLYQFLALFETFVFKIEAVFHQPFFQEFRDIVEGDMHENHAHDGRGHIEDDIQPQCVEAYIHRMIEQPYGEDKQEYAADQRVQHLPAGVELQMFFTPCPDTGNADQQHRGDLAVHEVAVVIYHPPFDTPVDVAKYAAPVVECGRVYGIFEKFHQHGYIDDRAEYLVKSL